MLSPFTQHLRTFAVALRERIQHARAMGRQRPLARPQWRSTLLCVKHDPYPTTTDRREQADFHASRKAFFTRRLSITFTSEMCDTRLLPEWLMSDHR
jgi:hypothetical protein